MVASNGANYEEVEILMYISLQQYQPWNHITKNNSLNVGWCNQAQGYIFY